MGVARGSTVHGDLISRAPQHNDLISISGDSGRSGGASHPEGLG